MMKYSVYNHPLIIASFYSTLNVSEISQNERSVYLTMNQHIQLPYSELTLTFLILVYLNITIVSFYQRKDSVPWHPGTPHVDSISSQFNIYFSVPVNETESVCLSIILPVSSHNSSSIFHSVNQLGTLVPIPSHFKIRHICWVRFLHQSDFLKNKSQTNVGFDSCINPFFYYNLFHKRLSVWDLRSTRVWIWLWRGYDFQCSVLRRVWFLILCFLLFDIIGSNPF
jgi:hypothetical protein